MRRRSDQIERFHVLDAAIVTLSEFEIKRCEKLVAEFIQRRRPPAHLRKEADLAFRISGQSVELLEIRPHWTGKGKPIEHRIAKATYNKRNHGWKIFWQRAEIDMNRSPKSMLSKISS